MKSKKLVVGALVSITLGSASGLSSAAIVGVPGEAALVPMVLGPDGDGVNINTYVGIYIPEFIGADTVISQYTAPHAAPGATDQVFEGKDAIHWTLFDENSKKIEDGDCDASPGDVVLWSTDPAVRFVQQQQQAGILSAGVQDIPSPVCGPTTNDWRFGYLVIQTNAGATAQDADFAFWTQAAVVDNGVFIPGVVAMAGVPTVAMADGADPDGEDSVPVIGNEVVQADGSGSQPAVPVAVSPVLGGIRMQNADGDDSDDVRIEAPLPGPAAQDGMALHVFWFDQNDPDRVGYIYHYDDHEGRCTNGKPMPRELDMVLWNHQVVLPGGFASARTWNNLTNGIQNRRPGPTEGIFYTQVIDAVNVDRITGYQSGQTCKPPYWLPNAFGQTTYPGAMTGYVDYEFEEQVDEVLDGAVHAAAVAFNWQQSMRWVNEAWSSHLSTDLGKLDF